MGKAKVPAKFTDNHRTSIFAPLQGKWAPPPATLAVCQLTYRHLPLGHFPCQCQTKIQAFPGLKSSSFRGEHFGNGNTSGACSTYHHPVSVWLQGETLGSQP